MDSSQILLEPRLLSPVSHRKSTSFGTLGGAASPLRPPARSHCLSPNLTWAVSLSSENRNASGARNRGFLCSHAAAVNLAHEYVFWRDAPTHCRGRAQETYGESPTLTGLLAKRMVAGLQGNDSTYYRVAAMPKHFDAYGGATSRHHRSPTEVTVSWRDWVETFRPVWRHLLGNDETAAAATMCRCGRHCPIAGPSLFDPYPSRRPHHVA